MHLQINFIMYPMMINMVDDRQLILSRKLGFMTTYILYDTLSYMTFSSE